MWLAMVSQRELDLLHIAFTVFEYYHTHALCSKKKNFFLIADLKNHLRKADASESNRINRQRLKKQRGVRISEGKWERPPVPLAV